MKSRIVLIVIAFISAACSAQPGVAPASVDSTPGAREPSPTPHVTVQPNPISTEGPIDYPPYNVWNLLASGGPSGAVDIGEATTLADSVVLGRLVSIEEGEAYGPNENELGWYAVATIRVEEVIAGADPGETLTVPFILLIGGDRYPAKVLDDLQASLPDESTLLFVRSWATYFAFSGTEIPGWLRPLDRSDIYRLIGKDGAILVRDGRLDPPTYDEYWSHSLTGASVDEVTDLVRAVDAVPG